MRTVLTALGFVLGVNLLGSVPALVFDSDTGWFDRPWFYPPDVLVPVVWTLLFTLLGLTLFEIWRCGTAARRERERRAVTVAYVAFAAQFALNLAWTPVVFGLRSPGLGLVVIAALWIAVVVTIVAFDRVSRLAAILLVPYLGCVTFALALNYAIYAG